MANSEEEVRSQLAIWMRDEARYRKWTRQCNRRQRERGELAYWQRREWKRFIEHYPQYSELTELDVLSVFRVCHVHWLPLKTAQIPIVRGLWDVCYTRDFEEDIAKNAPYSKSWAIDAPYESVMGDLLEVDQCDECLQYAERKWPGHSAAPILDDDEPC